LPEVDSTNSWAAAHLTTNPTTALPLLVTCERQTAGRGRGQRRWWQQAGGLAFSVVIDCGTLPLSPEQSHAARQGLPLWTALCLQETAATFLPAERCQLKWPNDLLIRDRKNAGILLEAVPQRPDRVIVGIGVNINNPRPPDGSLVSESFFSWSETERVFSIPDVLREFLGRWLPLNFWQVGELDRLLAKYAAVDWLPGKQIVVHASAAWCRNPAGQLALSPAATAPSGTRPFQGLYQGLSSEGYLQLRDPTGVTWVFPSVEQVRPLA
jgi:biotin-[acetyl-CoA-carboxylase] ligase BirA-like protein